EEESQMQDDTLIQNPEQNQTIEQTGENHMLQWRYRYRENIQEGIQNNSVAMECNISKKAGKLYVHSYEYQKGMTLEIKEQSQHRLQIKVAAEFKEGKVLVLNIEGSAFKVKNSQQLKVKFDGKEIGEANIDEVISGNSTQAKYTAAIGEDGGQYLVYIPHFSEHLISFEIIDVATGQSLSFIVEAIGVAILTVAILILVVVKIGKLKKEK
ncbi:MAG: hypothetical protein KAJ51_10495, partial [Thermoplasmata archaeon]|nr:hypothetical protein [Thermoplasmata archaeon]